MKKLLMIVMVLAAGMAARGDEAAFAHASGATMRLDTRTGTRIAAKGASETIAYSPKWGGVASCTVTADGTTLKTASAEGEVAWSPTTTGAHTLTHTAGSVAYTAQFTVLGDDVTQHAGALAASETWASNTVHLVTADVTVPSGKTLTIAPGAVVKFMTGTSLTATGTCMANGVIFTHVNDDTVGGDTLMDGDAEKPVIDGYKLIGNIYENDATEERYTAPQTLSSSISGTLRLKGHKVYLANSSITVNSGATLTLLPGAIIKFASGCSLTVNGTLDAQGTRAAPIVFTSAKDDEWGGDTNGDGESSLAQPGDWRNIVVTGSAKLSYTDVLYGGGASTSSDTGMITVRSGGKLDAVGCVMAHGLYDGVFSYGTITGEDLAIYDCDRGVNTSGGSGVFKNCVIDRCRWGVMSEGGSGTYYNCIITRFFGSSSWPTGWGVAFWSGSLKTYSCCVWSDLSGSSNYRSSPGTVKNISADPLFLDPDNGDFRIAANSPCVDAGDGTVAPAVDFYGQPRMDVKRVKDTGVANADGVCPDIGIYEVPGSTPLPMPDLAVLSVSGPTAAAPGEEIAVTYVVTNRGAAAASGMVRDRVVLRSDVALGGEEILVDEVEQLYSLAVESAATFTARVKCPAVKNGLWSVGVTVNGERDVFEGVATADNSAYSEFEMEVNVKALELEGEELVLTPKESTLRMMTLPPGSALRLMKVVATPGVEILVGVDVPTENQNLSAVFSFGDALWISLPQEWDDFYVLARNPQNKEAACRIELMENALSVFGCSDGVIPYDGIAAVRVDGACLDTVQMIQLRSLSGVDTPMDCFRVDSPNHLIVQVDGTKLAAGERYRIVLSDGSRSVVSDCEMLVGTSPLKAVPWARLSVPETVRFGREYVCFVEYGNEGTAQMKAPVLAVDLQGDGTLAAMDGETGRKTVFFVGVGSQIGAGILAPGETGRVMFKYRVGAGDSLKLRTSFGKTVVAPEGWNDESAFLEALSQATERVAVRGQDSSDYCLVRDVAESMRDHPDQSCSVYGWVFDVDGNAVVGKSVSFTNLSVRISGVTDANGRYVIAPIVPGDYLSDMGDGSRFSVSAGADARQDIRLREGGLSGVIYVANASETACLTLSAFSDMRQFDAERLSEDSFGVRGLDDGMYLANLVDGAMLAQGVLKVTGGKFIPIMLEPVSANCIKGTVRGVVSYDDLYVSLSGVGFERASKVAEDGTYIFANLPSGLYDVALMVTNSADFATGETIELKGGETNVVDIVREGSVAPKTVTVRPASKARLQGAMSVSQAISAGERYLRQYSLVPPTGEYKCSHNMSKYRSDVKTLNAYRQYIDRLNELSLECDWKNRAIPVLHGLELTGQAAATLSGNIVKNMGKLGKVGTQLALAAGDLAWCAYDLATGIDDFGNGLGVYSATGGIAITPAELLAESAMLETKAAKVISMADYQQVKKISEAMGYLGDAVALLGYFDTVDDAMEWGEKLAKAQREYEVAKAALDVCLDNFNRMTQHFLSIATSFNNYKLCCPESPKDDYPPNAQQPQTPRSVQSWDPNEIVGPVGIGDGRCVKAGDEMIYTIYFENKADASAAAQEVWVTTKLDDRLDWDSFVMGEVGFGSQIDTGLAGLQSGTSELSIMGTNQLVRSRVQIDRETGTVEWYLRIVDPTVTCGWPEDATAGFLPPNDPETHCGEGHLTYRIKVREDAPANVVITNSATIVFDYNEPIETDPAWWNTVTAGGEAGFATAEQTVDEGGALKIVVNGGNMDLASSVQVQVTYNTAAAADLDLKNAMVNGEKPKNFKFPVTLNWAAGEIGEKAIEIPVAVDKAVEADEMLTLQLVNPMNLTIAGSDGEGAVVTQGSACTVTIRDPGYGDLKAKVVAGSATKAEADALAKADKVFAGKAYVRGLANDATRGKVAGSALAADGKNVTLKATANKGWVFAGWYTDAACTAGHELTGFGDYRNPSLAYVNTNGAVTVYARFIAPEEDSLALGEGFLPGEFAPGADCSIAVPVESVSYPTVKVTGLPAGMKFADKETLVKATKTTDAYTVEANTIYGAPTKAAAKPAVVTVTVKNLGGYQIVRQYEVTVKEGMSPVATWARVVSDAAPYQSVAVDVADDFSGTVSGAGVYQAGKKVTLKATANKGYVFSGWYEGEGLLTQAASLAFTMPSNDVSYVAQFVTAEEDAASVATGVNGVTLDPAATFATNVMTGVALQWPVAADALSQTTVTVSGLPAGLKFTAKDVVDSKTKQVTVPANTIYGAPTAASKVDKSGVAVPFAVNVTATTAGKAKRVYPLALTVDPLPVWTVGTFNGPALLENVPNGLATLTIANTGKISGKLLTGGLTWSLAAGNFIDYSPTDGFLASLIGTSGKLAFTNELTVTTDVLGGLAQSERFAAAQNNWKVEPWKSRAATFGKTAAVVVSVGGDQPGEISLKFATSGAVTAAGAFKTGVDAKGKDMVVKATCATAVCPDGAPDATGAFEASVFVYFPPKGAFAGYSACIRLRWDGTQFVVP